MKRMKKTINFEIKEVDDQDRSFLAVGSTDDIDRDNDRIFAAGWDLENFKKNPVIPWSHRYGDPPVAKAIDVFTQEGRLMFRPKFASAEEYPFADTIYKLYKGGFLHAFSVGFDPKRYEIVERGKGGRGFDILEQELWEISACTVPANPNALMAATMKGIITNEEAKIAEGFFAGTVSPEGETKDLEDWQAADDVIEDLESTDEIDAEKPKERTIEQRLDEIDQKTKDILAAMKPAKDVKEKPETEAGPAESGADEQPEIPSLSKVEVSEIMAGALDSAVKKLGEVVDKKLNEKLGIVP